MKKNKFTIISRYFIILIIFIILFLLNIYGTYAQDTMDENNTVNISTISSKTEAMDFVDVYSSFIRNSQFSSDTIDLNGKINRLIELPKDSLVVKLPNDKIAIKYSNKTTSILPKGSYLIDSDNNTYITISNQDMVLLAYDVIDLPIYNFTKSANYVQSIDNLNEYYVKIVFKELDNPELYDNIKDYSVDWGDGYISSYNPYEKNAIHEYKKSGSYLITINVSDDFGFIHSIKQDFDVEYEGDLVHGYLWAKENKEPIAVTTTSISLLSVGLFALTETGKYKLLALLPLLIPMYTRIQREDVLDQFVRGQIYGYIRSNPGVHYNQIRRGIDVKNGTLSYHLSVLEKTELIKSRREGVRYRVFYPTGMKFPKKERFRLTEFQIQIINIIKENEGINQKEIALKLDKKPQTINYNIKILEQAELIKIVKKGRKTFCYPNTESETSDKHAE